MELALVAAWCFLVAVAGGAVGLVLGNIRLPIILLAATNPAAGAGANIGVSGVAALTAAIAHIRAGRIDWRLVAWLTPPSMVGAVLGGYVSGKVPKNAFLATIGVLLLLMALDLLRRRPPPEPRRMTPVETVLIGGGIGLLGGFVGLILGSLRLPAMLRMGEPLATAIGTNVTVGFFVGAAGVVGHLPGGVDWKLLAVGAAASIPGALIGARLTGRLPEAELKRAIAGSSSSPASRCSCRHSSDRRLVGPFSLPCPAMPGGDDLRSLMRLFPAGVCVVGANAHGDRIAVTVGSLVSLSLEPPLVGISIGRDLALHEVLRSAGAFGVSILRGDQAARCGALRARRAAHRVVAWSGDTGRCDRRAAARGRAGLDRVPIWAEYDAGDHTLFVGEVVALEEGETGPALVYRGHGYVST